MKKLLFFAIIISMASCQKKQQFSCTCYLYGTEVSKSIWEEKDFVDAYNKCKSREGGIKEVTCVTQ